MSQKEVNFILDVDYYKVTHHLLYPVGTEHVTSYVESRGGVFSETVFNGLQPELSKFEGVVIKQWMIDEAEVIMAGGFGDGCGHYFNREGWQYIVDQHGGKLPISIRAVREGTVLPTNNVLMVIDNTDTKCAWLVNYLETRLLRSVWYPTTVASLSYDAKKSISMHCDTTGSTLSPFHLNDFGCRGVSSRESAQIGGTAHLINFLGTDNIDAVKYIMDEYDEITVYGGSVMASEHSTTTIYGKSGELEAFTHFLDNVPDHATISIVIDSYDDENAVKSLLGGELRNRILSRAGKVVFRPDSGDATVKPIQVVGWLYDIFGGTVNDKGYKVLNPKVGCIQGDGIDVHSIKTILKNLTDNMFATECLIFGCGGGLLQQVNRDTMRFAMKCNNARINGEWRAVFKDPVTDTGKRSKRGALKLVKDGTSYKTLTEYDIGFEDAVCELVPVFMDGELLNKTTFAEIKERANIRFK